MTESQPDPRAGSTGYPCGPVPLVDRPGLPSSTDPAARLGTVLAATPADPEPEVITAAAVLAVDHARCVAAGRTARDRVAPTSPDPGPDWSERAARQGELGALTDADDVHWDTLVHPGSVIWPVVDQLGAAIGANGAVRLRAAIVGYDAVVRMARALGPDHRRSFHPTATAGAVGVAACAAALLELGPTLTGWAIGHAWSLLGGASGAIPDRGGYTRILHRGHAIRTGVAAARAAAAGGPAADGAAILATGAFGPGVADRLAFDPVSPTALLDTRARLVETAGADPLRLAADPRVRAPTTVIAVAGKWGAPVATVEADVHALVKTFGDQETGSRPGRMGADRGAQTDGREG